MSDCKRGDERIMRVTETDGGHVSWVDEGGLVRCRECEYTIPDDDGCIFCTQWAHNMPMDGYCHLGEMDGAVRDVCQVWRPVMDTYGGSQ